MASSYVDLNYVRLIGNVPGPQLDHFVENNPGSFEEIVKSVSGMVDSRLRKRYAIPFAEPYPDAIKYHCAMLVCYAIWSKIGFLPGSAQDEMVIKGSRDDAWLYIKEAADSVEGLVELPLKEASPSEGGAIRRGGPIGSSFLSPYSFHDMVAARIRGGGR